MAADKKPRRGDDDLIDWFTISYRTIYLVVGLVVVVAAVGFYYYTHRSVLPPPLVTDAPAPTTTARFKSLEGTVKVKTVGTFEWVSADANMVLRKSDLVRTGAGSTAEISFFDGTVVHVRPDSLITIEETSEDPSTKRRRVAWHISSGEVNFQTVKKNVPDSATEISTPTVRATAGEMTGGGVRVAQSGDSDVRVYQGTSRVETKAGDKFELGANEAVKVDQTGKAQAKITLPSVPALLSPPHQTEITYVDPARSTTLLIWKPVPGAVQYHVMLDYSAYFNKPLVDSMHKVNSVEVQGLDTAKYYWRVAAVDKDGAEGAYSEYWRFTVNRTQGAAAANQPRLVLEAFDVRANILQVKGRTDAGATVTINGQRADVQSDGSFNEFVTLEIKSGPQAVVLRATGFNGGINEVKRSVVVSF
jgi:hypothetical protein